jgi:putative ABC transport system permease protein
MAARVALARKNLFQDRRRAALSLTGVGAALMLVLVLDGVFAGAMRQVTSYLRSSPADVLVAQRDVRTMHMSASALPSATAERVRAVDGVAWAEELRYTTGFVESGRERRLTYVFGYDPTTGRAGPSRLTAGTAPGAGEVVVDETAAGELGVGVGGSVVVLGHRFAVGGLSADGTNIVNTTVFLSAEEFTRVRGPAVAYVLVGVRPGTDPSELAARVAGAVPGTTVQTRDEFIAQEARIVRDMAADVMRIMSVVGFLIALAVIGLTLFTTTLGKLREYGVVKALGAGPGRLAAIVLVQAGWSVALGLVVAVAGALAVGALIGALTPNVRIAVEPGAVLRTGAAALVTGALAALVPLRRVVGVDPATAFRRG